MIQDKRYGVSQPLFDEKKIEKEVGFTQGLNAIGGAVSTAFAFKEQVKKEQSKEELTAYEKDSSLITKKYKDEAEQARLDGRTNFAADLEKRLNDDLANNAKNKGFVYNELSRKNDKELRSAIMTSAYEIESQNLKYKSVKDIQDASELSADVANGNLSYALARSEELDATIELSSVPDHLKSDIKKASRRTIFSGAYDGLLQRDPKLAGEVVQSNDAFKTTYSPEERDLLSKKADEAYFKRLADENIVALNGIMSDEKKAKSEFKWLDDSEIAILKKKSEKLYKQHLDEVKKKEKEQKEVAKQNFYISPTIDGLKILKDAGAFKNKKEYEDAEEALAFEVDKNTKTIATEFLPQIKEFTEGLEKIDLDSQDLLEIGAKKAVQFKQGLMEANKKGYLSEGDYNKYSGLIDSVFQKNVIKQFQDDAHYFKTLREAVYSVQPMNQGVFSGTKKEFAYEKARGVATKEAREAGREYAEESDILGVKETRISEVVNYAIPYYFSLVASGDVEEAHKVIQYANRQVVDIKYPYLKNLKKDDKFILNGVVYVFKGTDGISPIISTK